MKNKKLFDKCDLFYKLASGKKSKNPLVKELEEAGRSAGFEVRHVGEGSDAPFHLRKLNGNELAQENLDRTWQYPFEFTDLSEASKTADKLYQDTRNKYLVVDSFGMWRYFTESEKDKAESLKRRQEERAEEEKLQLEYDLEHGQFSDEAIKNKKNNILN